MMRGAWPAIGLALTAGLFDVAQAQDVSASTPQFVCAAALDSGWSGWTSQPSFARHVTEVQRRGYSVAGCVAFLTCRWALTDDRAGWTTASGRASYVLEAAKRGYSIAWCRQVAENGPPAEMTSAAARPSPQAPASDPLVAAIQTLLSSLGFDVGLLDGIIGPQTIKAIAIFQTAIGDKADGQPSEALRAKLQKAVAERNVSPPLKAVPEPRKPSISVAGSGTGFFIGRDILVTNQHVVDGCTELRTSRSGADIGSARMIAVSKSDDLAVLKSEKAWDSYLELRVGAPLKPAESVVVFGFPLSGALSSAGNTTLGSITALTGLRDDSRYIQISAAVQPGNSGGPVLDDSGRLVGVVQGKLDAIKMARAVGDIPQNVNFAIRSTLLSNFLEANHIPYEVATKAEVLPNTKVAERASAASVQFLCLK